ncbi:MAG TPA: class I SAM-dependent methyltransferase [Pyrinomonadaceae bacterium]|nr:class I SAM-dependent methyltransferase [Pyrinomonadaceae bacterium]
MNEARLQQMTPEMEALKTKLKATWVSGDFGKIAESFTAGAAEFVERLGLKPGMRVLDVACGSGNQSIPAAKTGAEVTGVDIAPNLVEQARNRAEDENLRIRFDEGDAENLPYADAEFDVVMTMFGAMFAPRPDKVSAELLRVCRPGGVIAMGNWTPAGFIGQMFKIVGSHVSPPANMPSPLLWGDPAKVRERFGDAVSEINFQPRTISFTFPFGVKETIEFWREFYGPTNKAFAALDGEGQNELRRDLEKLWSDNNLAHDGTMRVESEYLEITAIRRDK